MTMEHKELCLMLLNLFQMHAYEETDGSIDWDMTLHDFMDWLECNDGIFITLKGIE